MLIIGSDRIAVSGHTNSPEGPRHAVDRDGRVLCGTTRPRFTWPALTWESAGKDVEVCSLCAQARNAREALTQIDTYPSVRSGALTASPVVSTAMPSTAMPSSDVASEPVPLFAPWQPGPGLFIPNEQ